MSTDDLGYYDLPNDRDFYPPKEEPDCGCNDHGWVRAWGWRRVLARLSLRRDWRCPGCNPSWLDRLPRWPRTRQPAGGYADEPPF